MNTFSSDIIFGPQANISELPIRKVSAIAIYNSFDLQNVLIVQRSQLVDEFKGAWSFPSVYNNDADKPSLLLKSLKDWLQISISDYCLISERVGLRKNWRLHMFLYMGITHNQPIISTTKYQAFKWVDGFSFFSQFNYTTMGDCSKAYIDFIKQNPEFRVNQGK